MKKIKWLFFDIGSTLVDESNAYRRRIERTVLNSDITINEFYSMYKKNMKDDNEIAKHFNVSQVQISRLEKQVIDKLKQYF